MTSLIDKKSIRLNIKPLALALIAAGVLSACGGGGGGDDNPPTNNSPGNTDGGSTNPPPTNTGGGSNPPPSTGGGGSTPSPDTSLTMSCVDGTEYQCSGGTVIKTDNGVALTRSGVQVFGISVSDIALDTADPGVEHPGTTNPTGFALPSTSTAPVSGVAEVRVKKDATNAVTNVGLLLDDFGLTWDGKVKRPLIVETFLTTQGRVELDPATKALVFKPLPTDPAFYDFTTKGANGTQANYANNAYFPLADGSVKCATGVTKCNTDPIKNNLQGTWRTANGTGADWAEVGRLHEDGDKDAPNVPFAGTKGYRGFTNLAYEFTNLAAWNSQDTVNIAGWLTQPKVEHNKERRGLVAFGNVTSPDAVPTSGTATYVGTVYGLYGLPGTTQDDPDPFTGDASVTVDYAAGTATITVRDAKTFGQATVPATFTTAASRGAITVNGASTNAPNYFTGTIDASGAKGGVSGRYFGPAAKEIGGTFQLTTPAGETVIGGFIGRKP